jgi:Domain of unknown function (DUF4336)
VHQQKDKTMLAPFGPAIWLVDGPVVTAAVGFHFPTRMAVIRLGSGDLMLWSLVEPTAELLRQVLALGPVRHIVAPTKLHNLFLAPWKAACPDAMLHAAPGLRDRRRDIAFDADLAGQAHPAWAGDIDLVLFRNRIADEIVFFHRESGTVLFADLLQNLPRSWFRGWRAWVARADGMTGPEPAVPRKFRLGFTDRTALRQALGVVLSWPARQVVMAHGTPILRDAPAFLARAFAWAGP